MVEFLEEYRRGWVDHVQELLEVIEAPADRVLALVRQSSRGLQSGVPIVVHFFEVITFRDGKVRRIEYFRHRSDAMEAAGLLGERDLAGPAYEDQDLVFCDEIGRPIYPTRLGERFVKARKAAGIPSGTLHILRHTSATLALTAIPPVPLHVVGGRLGDDPKTVLATYAHLLPHPTRWLLRLSPRRSLTNR